MRIITKRLRCLLPLPAPWEAFAEKCRVNGSNPSAVLRAAIDAYMSESEPEKQKE